MFEIIDNDLQNQNTLLASFKTARFKYNSKTGFTYEVYDQIAKNMVSNKIKPERLDDDDGTPYLDAFIISPINPFRWYHETGFTNSTDKANNIPVCYTRDTYSKDAKPSAEVQYKQANTCGECQHFTGIYRNGKKSGAACKFRNIAYLVLEKEPNIVMDFNMPSTSYLQAGASDIDSTKPLPLNTLVNTAKKALKTSVGRIYAVRMIPTLVNNVVVALRFIEREYVVGSNKALEEFITTNAEEIKEYIQKSLQQPIPTKKDTQDV